MFPLKTLEGINQLRIIVIRLDKDKTKINSYRI